MKVTLRKREKNGKISLYLDYYHRGKRKLEYLRLYLVHKPHTALERDSNRKTLDLAENIRAKRQIEMQNGIFGFNDAERLNSSFIAYTEVLAEKRRNSDGNYGNWLSAISYLKKFSNSGLTFADIDASWLEDYKYYLVHEAQTKQKNSLSKNSCVSYFNKIVASLKQATKDGILAKNPSLEVDGIKEAETRREFLTLDELQKIALSHCDLPIMKQAFLFSCLTGLRFSDVQKLTWSEIHHSTENGYYIRFTQKKTEGQETLPISDEAAHLCGTRLSANEPVFIDLSYSDSNNQKLREWMIRSVIEKHITFHSARHTYATLQLTLGTDIYTVSKLLGHKSLKTTKIYPTPTSRQSNYTRPLLSMKKLPF